MIRQNRIACSNTLNGVMVKPQAATPPKAPVKQATQYQVMFSIDGAPWQAMGSKTETKGFYSKKRATEIFTKYRLCDDRMKLVAVLPSGKRVVIQTHG